MGRKRRYKAEEVAQAIIESDGILAAAARKLGCARKTVYSYIENYATVNDAYQEASETVLDLAESKLIDAVESGQLPAIMFVLKTKGKHRGYVERQEVTGADGDRLKIEYVNDWRNSTPLPPSGASES